MGKNSKNNSNIVSATVVERLSNTQFRLQLGSGSVILATPSRKMRKRNHVASISKGRSVNVRIPKSQNKMAEIVPIR